jgi:hypothetical protein
MMGDAGPARADRLSSVDRLIEVVEDKIVRRAETKFNQLLERRNSKLRVEIV